MTITAYKAPASYQTEQLDQIETPALPFQIQVIAHTLGAACVPLPSHDPFPALRIKQQLEQDGIYCGLTIEQVRPPKSDPTRDQAGNYELFGLFALDDAARDEAVNALKETTYAGKVLSGAVEIYRPRSFDKPEVIPIPSRVAPATDEQLFELMDVLTRPSLPASA